MIIVPFCLNVPWLDPKYPFFITIMWFAIIYLHLVNYAFIPAFGLKGTLSLITFRGLVIVFEFYCIRFIDNTIDI